MDERIEKKLSRAITVAELIELLQDQPPEARVAFSSDYGDHCHTRQIHLIEGECEEREVRESAYSDSGLAETREDGEDSEEEEDERPTILIIS